MSWFEVGDRLAGYELLELAGEGRTGQVFRALQPRLERVVAVKIIRPELVEDDGLREQFRREMRLAGSVDHPNIVPVYEADERDGALFAAVRWIAGPSLHGLIADRGSLAPSQATRILGQVAAALEAAHGVGLVHRDLKPTNVLLEGDRVYLSDLGLAAFTNLAGREQLSDLVGDVEYSAPELLDNARPDPRTDVYGLGCLLYEMLVGSAPFPVETLASSPQGAQAIGPVPASELRPELPGAIDRVLERALAAAPADRYRTPAEFMDAVTGALGAPGGALAPRSRRRRRLLAALAALTILAAALAAVIVLPRGDHGDKPAASKGPVGGRQLPALASLSPCGQTFAGPPRYCRPSQGDGMNVITDLGKPLRLATMDFTATAVREARELHDFGGAGFSAPSGTRFVVIDATVTNLTKTPLQFEPNNLSVDGRETALWLFTKDGEIAPYKGKNADYSVQYNTVLGSLRTPLNGIELAPGIPFSGQLLFYYPTATLDADRRALLVVHELGSGFDDLKTVGGIRMHL